MKAVRLLIASTMIKLSAWIGLRICLSGSVFFAQQTPAQNISGELAPESVYEGVVRSGGTERLRFQVKANEYFTLHLLKPLNGFRLVLSTPDGRVRRSAGCFRKEPTR